MGKVAFDRSALDQFDNVTPAKHVSSVSASPLRLRKTLKEKAVFGSVNAVVGPPLALSVIQIASEGIRELLDVTTVKLWRIALPFMERLEFYEGWSELDLAHVISLLLFIAVTLVWIRIIKELKGFGSVMESRKESPALFCLYAGAAGTLLLMDAVVFFLGIQARGGGWGDLAWYTAPLCTACYIAGIICFAIFHADYSTSKRV
ncbi:hypothetical protein [Rhodopirellula baltica]